MQSTLLDTLGAAAAQAGDRRAFTHIAPAGEDSHRTYAQLHARARAAAAALQRTAPDIAGRPVLVVFPTGFDFLESFLGALYAGAIAVPARMPGRAHDHLANIAADSGARIGLTTPELKSALADSAPDVRWLTPADIEAADPEAWRDPGVHADDVAYLQYTSGSTSRPKGVMVSHRNVIANCEYFTRILNLGEHSRVLTWLPHFHDFGLVFGLFGPLYNRCAGYILSPMAFAQRPAVWLEAMSRHRVTHSASPNFGYQACLGISDEQISQIEALDLSSLNVCLNGAEPVRADTIAAFAERFAPHGFAPQALCPGYGLAEATLVVSVCQGHRRPVVVECGADALADGRLAQPQPGERAQRLVGSGDPDPAVEMAVIDPDSCARCADGAVGEIWLAGESVAGGYWNNPDATARKFGARIMGEDGPDGGKWLRTGDFGVRKDGEIFVLGRMDDLIIVRGANFAPEDIELTVEAAHPALIRDGGAAVAAEIDGEPRLAVFQEVDRHALRGLDGDAVARAIVAAVSERHQLEVACVVLLKPRALPRTHSGKKQRHACRRAAQEGALSGEFVWVAPGLRHVLRPQPVRTPAKTNGAGAAAAPQTDDAADARKLADLTGWLRAYAGERLNSRLMDERRTMPPYVVLDLGNRGVLGLQAPERHGGLGLGNRAYSRVLEQMAAIDLTLASFTTVNNCLGVRPIMRHAGAALRDELLPVLAPGRQLAAFAMTEAGAGSNVRGIQAEGRPDGDGWRLWGTKVWSGSAAWAGVINTFVRVDDGAPGSPRGVTGFVVRNPSEGLRIGPEALTMGLRAMAQNEVNLEGVRVTDADMLGEPGRGMDVAMETMEFGRFSVAALGVGVIKRCLQLMVRHGARRSIATGRLLANPATLARISELSAAATALEAMVALVAARLDRGEATPPEFFCACKSAGAETAWRAADQLVQQLAGRGYVETNVAPQILRDTRILRIFEGPSEPMNMHIGARLAQQPEELRRVLSEELGEPALAAEIEAAAAQIVERCAALPNLSGPQAEQWAFLQAGEVGAFGLLLASVQRQNKAAPSPELERAETWARMRFDRRLAKALALTPAEAVMLDATAAEDAVSAYADTIGDIEQRAPDEGRALDPILLRDPDASARPAKAANGHDASPAGPEAPADPDGASDIAAWVAAWLAETFDRPAREITPASLFSEFGMDSVRAVILIGDLEERYGVSLPTTLIWDYPSVGALAAHLADAAQAPGAAATAPQAASAATLPRPALSNAQLLERLDQLSTDEIANLLAATPDTD